MMNKIRNEPWAAVESVPCRKKEDPKNTPDAARQPFAVGTRVRVRHGTKDPDYPDIPLGGWTGTVVEMSEGDDGRTYHVEWDADAVRQMHPTYRHRCERDGLEIETAWLDETDLELNTGSPVEIEQPTRFRPRRSTPANRTTASAPSSTLPATSPCRPPIGNSWPAITTISANGWDSRSRPCMPR